MRVHLVDGAQAELFKEQMRDLYADVYAEPPYNEGPEHVERFISHFDEECQREGFALAVAVDDDLLVGAAYGWTMGAGRWWKSALTDPPAEIQAAEKFAIMEWMVRAPYRGRGVGRQVLDLVLAQRHEPYAVLASNPQAPARRIYDRLGWRHCGTSAPDLMPPMDLLALPLSAENTSTTEDPA